MSDILRTKPAKVTKPRADQVIIRKPKFGNPIIRLELEAPAVQVNGGEITYLEPDRIDRIGGIDIEIDQAAALEEIEITSPVTGQRMTARVADVAEFIAEWAGRRINAYLPEDDK
jgi:hypothetical protein